MTINVSVIMPCYNEPEDIFRRSLESLLNQTLKDIEIILILDKPDNIELIELINKYRILHKNIISLRPKENLGRGEARNLGISHATGKYIAIHDADDIDYLNRLEDQYNYMEENPDIGVVFSKLVHIDVNGIIVNIPLTPHIPDEDSKRFSTRGKNHPTMFIRKDIMDNMKYKNIDYSEDIDMFIRFFKNKINIGYLDKTHSQYLVPQFSEHSEYMEKMKGWKICTIKVLLDHIGVYNKDPYFYMKLCTAISDYIFIHFGKEIYKKYRQIPRSIKKSLITIEKLIIKKEVQ